MSLVSKIKSLIFHDSHEHKRILNIVANSDKVKYANSIDKFLDLLGVQTQRFKKA